MGQTVLAYSRLRFLFTMTGKKILKNNEGGNTRESAKAVTSAAEVVGATEIDVTNNTYESDCVQIRWKMCDFSRSRMF